MSERIDADTIGSQKDGSFTVERGKTVKRLLYALPALLVMGIIFYFSSQHAEQSSESSSYVLETVLIVVDELYEAMGKEPSDIHQNISMDWFTFIIRKIAHTTEYALLGGCLSFYFYKMQHKKKTLFLGSVLVGFLYACTDELHQFFVPGRSCEFRDVLIDTNGVFLGTLAFLFLLWLQSHIHRKKSKSSKARSQ